MNCMRSVQKTAQLKLAFGSSFLQKCGTVTFSGCLVPYLLGFIEIQSPETKKNPVNVAPDNQKMRQFHTFAKMNCQMPASILQFSAHSSSNSFKFDKKCYQKPKKPNPHAWPPAGLGTLLPYYKYTNTREARKCQQSSIIHFGPLLVLCCWSRSPPALLLIQ